MKKLIFLFLLLPKLVFATVPFDDSADRYVGNGATTVFAYNFKADNQSYIIVLLDATIKIIGTHYNVSGIGNSNGGTVTFLSAPASGTVVSILRNQPISQLTSYVANEAYNPLKIMGDFDKNTMVDQMQGELIARAIKFKAQSVYRNVPIDDPVASQFLRWNATATGIESVGISTLSSVGTATLAAGQCVFATSATNISTDSNCLWDNTNKILTAGTARFSASANMTPVFSAPNNTNIKTASYMAYNDGSSHANEIHATTAISAQPLGSGTNGPASADIGLGVSVLKQNYPTTSVGGEIDGIYVFLRQGPQGDAGGVLVDVGAYDSTGFTTAWESNNSQISSNVVAHTINNQIGVIHPSTDERIGFVASTLVGQGTSGYYLGGTWTKGINFVDATVGTAIALGANQSIAWIDSGNTLRTALKATGTDAVFLGWDGATPTNGDVIIQGGGNELGRFNPVVTSGQTTLSLRYHDTSSAVEGRVTLGAADSCGTGFKCLRIPN